MIAEIFGQVGVGGGEVLRSCLWMASSKLCSIGVRHPREILSGVRIGVPCSARPDISATAVGVGW
jgi:hypothetical protein